MTGLAAEPDGLLAAGLVERALGTGAALHVARSEPRAARLARAAAALAPDLLVLHLPGWDCLPYDRASPSRQMMGQRMAVLKALAGRGDRPVLLVAGIEAVTQRLPPPETHAEITLREGEALDEPVLEAALSRLGYRMEDRVDEPGEATLHGSVLDACPAGGALPFRVEHEGGRIASIRRYDPLTQRSLEERVEAVTLGPASEVVWPEGAGERHAPGLEHALPEILPGLVTPFALLPGAPVSLDPEVEELRAARWAEVEDAHRTRLSLATPEEGARPLPGPGRLYLDGAAWAEALAGHAVTVLEEEEAGSATPRFIEAEEPEEAFLAFLEERIAAGGRVALAGRESRRARALLRLVHQRLGWEADRHPDWPAFRDAQPGRFGTLEGMLEAGFATGDTAVVAPGDVRPPARRREAERQAAPALMDSALQPGDAVIHMDHGLGALRGVEAVTSGEAALDCLVLEYAGGAKQLVPLDETDRLWRYGAEAEGVSLDHLGGESWPKRRKAVEAQVAATAEALERMTRERDSRTAPVLRPRGAALNRFAAGFPHALTPDQEEGIEDVLADLASGRPMDRLVCGDVGFGKTEVALRAAAVAALAGQQVAVLAPTTVLVRQHLTTFRRRFAGMTVAGKPVRVEQLSRLSNPAEAKAVKAGIRDGSIHVVIGTQALTARGMGFDRLGLLIIDEEQRFGARQKRAAREMGRDTHVLAMTATPIPRTLQSALVGLQDLSVIATPPGRRQPIHTVHVPIDDAVLRQALLREHRRGGQSFVVVSRIEDLPAMRERIGAVLPDLSLIEAHGEMPADEVDTALVRFAEGDGDVLLSTNIVETGLDVPRANTMLVHRADRFGLSQLHQLRGRVGRGRVRGRIVLMTDPADPPSPLTLKRLKALEAHDRVGAGFAISARDMDLRGAGDLLGEEQAGHMRLIGLDLYQHLLGRALRRARGERVREDWTPQISIGIPAGIPEDHVEDEGVRVELHARLAAILRRGDAVALGDFAEEVDDRFGTPPEPLANLLALARLRLRCRRLGVAELKVGPSAAAATFREAPPGLAPPLERRGDRAVLPRDSRDAAGQLTTASALLDHLSGRAKARRKVLEEA